MGAAEDYSREREDATLTALHAPRPLREDDLWTEREIRRQTDAPDEDPSIKNPKQHQPGPHSP